MIKVFLLLIEFLFLVSVVSAQDNLKIMHYNLLNYGNYTSYCDSDNNDVDLKAENIEKIIKHVNPDIFTVNEMDNDKSDILHLLGNSLNTEGVDYYDYASILNNDNSSIINMLFYDSRNYDITGQLSVTTGIRDINIYKMKTLNTQEPINFNIAVTHLKAGKDSKEQRAHMTSKFMDYLNGYSNKDNWIFAGDLNVYTSAEEAYQNLVDPVQENVRFNDPVEAEGAWHNEYQFRAYHTQSTHDSDNGCASSGGMDDRFDFILVSDDILSGENDLTYVENSYKALGQDGNHFNDAVNSGVNNSAPQEVINALFAASDHLPVIAEFDIAGGNGIADNYGAGGLKIKNIKATSGLFSFNMIQTALSAGEISVITPMGRVIKKKSYAAIRRQNISINCNYKGLLVIKVSPDKGSPVLFRLVLTQ